MAYVQESRDPEARSIDWAGQLALGGGLFLLVLALLRGNDEGWGSTAILAELGGAVRAAARLRRHRDAACASRCCRSGCSRTARFAAAQLGAFAISASFFAVFLYTTLYLQNVRHLSAVEAGPRLHAGHGRSRSSSPARARSSASKVSHRVMVSGGLALVAIGMLLLTVVGTDSLWLVFLPGEIVALIGTGMFNPSDQRRGARLAARAPERPRRRRERHLPPGRHRRRASPRSAR